MEGTCSLGRYGPLRYCSSIRHHRNALPGNESIVTTWSVYLLRCADGSIYTGIATDVSRRLAEHEDSEKGAKYLRGRGPLELVFHQEIGDRSLALRIEHRIKRLPKDCKEDVARLPDRIEKLVTEAGRQSN